MAWMAPAVPCDEDASLLIPDTYAVGAQLPREYPASQSCSMPGSPALPP